MTKMVAQDGGCVLNSARLMLCTAIFIHCFCDKHYHNLCIKFSNSLKYINGLNSSYIVIFKLKIV